MGIEEFPEIENFQKLPKQVIVKGGSSTFDAHKGAELRGIVINNIGHAIRNAVVHVVVFDQHKIPLLSTSVPSEPGELAQGGIGSFLFQLKDLKEKINDYHLYTSWRFDDRE